MKAAFHTGVKQLSVIDIPKPVPKENECLVKITHCAICGSDVWFLDDAAENEPVHGHETVGVIEECGSAVSRFKAGDRVVCYAIHGCGTCDSCLAGVPTHCRNMQYIQGGFQEYSVYTEDLLFPYPEGVAPEIASLYSDAIGVPLRGMRRLKPEKDDRICVWGLGPLGLLQVMFLKAAGVKCVIGIDTVDFRTAKAKELGADYVINARTQDAVAEIRKICGGKGADKAYTYVRNDKCTASVFDSTRNGASICTFVGLGGHYDLPEWYERTLVWSFYFTSGEYEENANFIREHNIDLRRIVSDVIPLADIQKAFSKRFERQDESLKIVISME